MEIDFLFQIAILIMSVVVHEVAHGLTAYKLGDPTAKYEGRLTLNPIKHLDPVGSFLVPAISYFAGGFIFGWARPVPYNPNNLRPGRWSEALVALAGPASNIILAIIFTVFLRIGAVSGLSLAALQITSLIIFINILLAVFNLVPIPPLDGSKLLFSIFPRQAYKWREFLESFGFLLIIVFIFYGWRFISPIVSVLFTLLTGVPLS